MLLLRHLDKLLWLPWDDWRAARLQLSVWGPCHHGALCLSSTMRRCVWIMGKCVSPLWAAYDIIGLWKPQGLISIKEMTSISGPSFMRKHSFMGDYRLFFSPQLKFVVRMEMYPQFAESETCHQNSFYMRHVIWPYQDLWSTDVCYPNLWDPV